MKKLFNRYNIERKIIDLGYWIRDDYAKKENALFICVLKGSIHFTSDLLREISLDIPVEFIRVKSYVGTQSGCLEIISSLSKEDIEGKDVLIIEDIIDSGKTLNEIIFYFKGFDANSIEVCTLLDKPSARKVKVKNPKYVGFTIENQFIVGYGLDYNELYRNLNDIMILEEIDL
jgi:hypoxanthine phosphoribosyltransferase